MAEFENVAWRSADPNPSATDLITPRPDKQEWEGHPFDSPAIVKLHSRLMAWYTAERTRQSVNRYQQALDQDFYDNLQWNPEDIQTLTERGQAPLVFNLIKPVCDWLIGTERRTRIDWKILPRRNQGSELAEVKTKLMKYLDDVNHAEYNRSLAFKDAVICGVGWLDCGIRSDDNAELIYDAYENWRNVLYDSSSRERDYGDGRYLFRWKWVDEDMALEMFPDRRDIIRSAVQRSSDLVPMGLDESGEEFWYLGQAITTTDLYGMNFDRRTYVTDTAYVNFKRRRCRLIEGWWTEPVRRKVMRGAGNLHGEVYNEADQTHVSAVRDGIVSVFDGVAMEMHAAVFTEKGILWAGKSPYKHNKFPLTPIWCYRRGRDNAPYGVVRNLRDPQEDYNKRASKALWRLSAVRVVMEKGAVDDPEELREEVARPDCMVIKKRGSEFEIHETANLVQEDVMLMDRDHMHIQATSGVTDENLGRETNAVSGKAIQARQLQGSVVTSEIFDNARFARQLHGQKRLSLAEQFVSEPRVVRLTGAKGQLEWVSINEPVVNADGSVSFLNDVTAEQADFIVSEQDYHATYRQAMFEMLMETVGRLGMPPEIIIKLMPSILELSDIPDKDNFIAEVRKALGLPDPDAKLSPEEQAAQQAAARQAEAVQNLQLKMAIDEKQAKIDLTKAQEMDKLADAEKKTRESNLTLQQLAGQLANLNTLMQMLASNQPMPGAEQTPQAGPIPQGGAVNA